VLFEGVTLRPYPAQYYDLISLHIRNKWFLDIIIFPTHIHARTHIIHGNTLCKPSSVYFHLSLFLVSSDRKILQVLDAFIYGFSISNPLFTEELKKSI